MLLYSGLSFLSFFSQIVALGLKQVHGCGVLSQRRWLNITDQVPVVHFHTLVLAF